MTAVVLDIETIFTEAHKAAVLAELPPEFKAPSNYKDEAKIAESIKTQADAWLAGREQRIAHGALDPRTGRILALGQALVDSQAAATALAESEADELRLLANFWDVAKDGHTVVTFNGSFDLRFLLIRSLIRNVTPTLAPRAIAAWFRRYVTQPHFDCRAVLTNWDNRESGTLGDWCQALEIPHDDTVTGGDVYGLYLTGNFTAITDHCRSDVQATAQLYQRLAPFYAD